MIKSLYPIFRDKWSATGSVYIVSDTHFDDADCKYMNPNWITPEEHIAILKKEIHKNDVLIHLGDVGNASYLDELKCYKVLLTGNHDVLSKVASHFDEIYNGPLFIADRIVLSHEPIYGLESFALNIHGHVHNGHTITISDIGGGKHRTSHINLASDVVQWKPTNLKSLIETGFLADIPNYHRLTINKATEKKVDKDSTLHVIENIHLDNYANIPNPCKNCGNHPSNGGSGFCNCTLGGPTITC